MSKGCWWLVVLLEEEDTARRLGPFKRHAPMHRGLKRQLASEAPWNRAKRGPLVMARTGIQPLRAQGGIDSV